MRIFFRTLALLSLVAGPLIASEFQDVSDSFGVTRILAGVFHSTTLDTNGIGLNFWKPVSEGGLGTLVGLSNPHMAAADVAGNMYIADKASHSILRLTPDGLIHTFAGTHVAGFNGDGPATATSLQLSSPNGLFVLPDGTVYLLDPGNHRVRRVDTNGVMTTIVNDPEPLWHPSGRALWVSPDEQLIYYTHEFLALVINGVTNDFADGAAVKKWTATNGIETVCGKGVGFRNPGNIDVNPVDGKLYVCDRGEEDTNKLAVGFFRIDGPDQRTRLTGNIMQPAAADGQLVLNSFIDGPRGIAFRADGSYFLAGHRDGNVWFVDTAGIAHKYLRGKGSGDSYTIINGRHPPLVDANRFAQPRSVTITPIGDLLVVCNDSGYVFRVNSGPPVIRGGPVPPPAYFGSNVTVSVTVAAVNPPAYQWLKNGQPLPGETNAMLVLTNLGVDSRASYAVTVSNTKGSVTSSNATLAIFPAIVQQPHSIKNDPGSMATFSVQAEGVNALTYQWYRYPSNLVDGATASSLTIANAGVADLGGYFVQITSPLNGSVVSSVATLSFPIPPLVTAPPLEATVNLGHAASFAVTATGDAPLWYQWFFNEMLLPGETNQTFAIARTKANDAAGYHVEITNLYGAATSTVANLTILLPINAPRPVVTITSPAGFARVSSNMLSVAGTASASVGLFDVRVGTGAGTAILPASSTTLAWQAPLALTPGSNVIRAVATDLLGRSVTNSKVVFYSTTNLLSLMINPPGAGTVRGASNLLPLEVGRGYKLAAIPSAGFVFSNWTGGAVTSAPVLSIIMSSNLALTANFVTNPFTPWAGSYNGLYSEAGVPSHDRRGFISALVRPNGSYSGKLLNGRKALPFTGQFDLEGRSTNSLALELVLDLHGANQITGRVVAANGVAALIAYRAVFGRLNPSPYTNRYTLLIPGSTNVEVAPAGHGFGTATIDALGKIKFCGMLADGTPFTQSVPVSGNGEWPLYVTLYGGKGSVFGWVSFTNSAQPDLGGVVNWIRPPPASGKFYTNGFSSDSPLIGSAYTPPGTNRLIDLGTAFFTFTDDDLPAPLTNTIAFGPSGRITNGGPNNLILKAAPATGGWTGSLMLPGTNSVIVSKGIFLQKQRLGGGFHLGPDESNAVDVRP